MTNDPSLFARFSRWLNGDDNPLDEEIAHSMTEPSDLRLREISPELFAAQEAAQERRVNALREQEQRQYLRLHEWSVARGSKWFRGIYRTLAGLICVGIILFLLRTVVALPPFGAADNPYNNEVSQRYIEKGIEETGAVNFVAGMILDYRAFDTFGESTVLFVAACSVLLLLKLGDHAPGEKPSPAMLEAEYDDRHHEPKNDLVLQTTARILVPVVLLYGMYIILNGHLSPGGGFSGGAVMGAGLILYLNAFGFQKTERFFTYKTFRWVTFLSLMSYAGLKSYSFFMGANHLENGIPLGIPGAILSSGLILPLNVCVGFIVMCTMYAFYTLFRKGGM
ncbi:MAG: hydrogen gas-evolving membrane-bound hydrogenase subunit E [Clostridia bacterium]